MLPPCFPLKVDPAYCMFSHRKLLDLPPDLLNRFADYEIVTLLYFGLIIVLKVNRIHLTDLKNNGCKY